MVVAVLLGGLMMVADLVGPFATDGGSSARYNPPWLWACCLTVVTDLVGCQVVVAENDVTRTTGLGRP